jgi:hypothetical protein
LIDKLKYRLSHLRAGSWHRRFVDFAYWGAVKPRKACPYWWLIVPASPIAAGIKVIALGITYGALSLLVAIMWVVGNIAYVIMLVSGRRPINGYMKAVVKMGWMDDDNECRRTYERSNRRFAPYQFILPLLALAGLVVLWLTSWPWLPWAFLYGAGSIALLYGLGKLYTRVVHPIFRRLCPPISWE